MRNAVTTSYRKASRSPGLRRPRAKHKVYVTLVIPDSVPLSPVARYIEENKESGIPVHELILQFQEYDCEHLCQEIAYTATCQILTCGMCGYVEKRER